jgi:hypothetical protein
MSRVLTIKTAFRLIALTLLTTGSYFVAHRLLFGQNRLAFVVSTHTTAFDLSGKQVLSEGGTFAQRSDGSTVTIRNINGPGTMGPIAQRVVMDLVRGVQISVDQTTNSITTYPMTPSTVDHYRSAPTCAKNDASDVQSLLGFAVLHSTSDFPATGRLIRKETWRAPSLNCLALKEVISGGPNANELRVKTVKEALSITFGDPPSELFSIPQSYTERSPAAKREERLKRFPVLANPACLRQTIKRAEQAYNRSREQLVR